MVSTWASYLNSLGLFCVPVTIAGCPDAGALPLELQVRSLHLVVGKTDALSTGKLESDLAVFHARECAFERLLLLDGLAQHDLGFLALKAFKILQFE
jgi:hypothetical protein